MASSPARPQMHRYQEAMTAAWVQRHHQGAWSVTWTHGNHKKKKSSDGQGGGLGSTPSSGGLVSDLVTWESSDDQGGGLGDRISSDSLLGGMDTWESSGGLDGGLGSTEFVGGTLLSGSS